MGFVCKVLNQARCVVTNVQHLQLRGSDIRHDGYWSLIAEQRPVLTVVLILLVVAVLAVKNISHGRQPIFNWVMRDTSTKPATSIVYILTGCRVALCRLVSFETHRANQKISKLTFCSNTGNQGFSKFPT